MTKQAKWIANKLTRAQIMSGTVVMILHQTKTNCDLKNQTFNYLLKYPTFEGEFLNKSNSNVHWKFQIF